MTLPDSERKYVEEGRRLFASRFPHQRFDESSWDIRHLRTSQHKKTNARVYFTRHGSTTDALPERFASVVKSFLLIMAASAGTMPLRVDAARMLWKAIEARIGQMEFSWSVVSEQDLLDAEQQMLLRWGGAATYKRCTMLQKMISDLAAAPFGPIVPPMKVRFRTPRHEDFERYTIEGQELRQAKMPADEAIMAIGQMFAGAVERDRDRLILCALALLLTMGSRVGEVLTLPLNTEIEDSAAADLKYGLRYYKEKSRGGEKRLAIRWLTPAQAELAKVAIAEVRSLTASARQEVQQLEKNPALLHSTRQPLWSVDRRDGTFQTLSESLFIDFRCVEDVSESINRRFSGSLTEQRLNDFLGGRVERGRTIVKSGFERYNVRDSKGQLFSLHTHQFRHWMTTKAAQAGVPDHVIARWQGREHMGDLETYKHLTPTERLDTLKRALKHGSVKGQLAQMYFSLAEDVRDVFLEGQLQAVHVTPLGLCVHDFKVMPCPKFLNCVKDCEDYVLDTRNKNHIENLVQLQTRTRQTLDQARQQREKGENDLSENWLAEADATLSGVTRILAAAAGSDDIVRPFIGRYSKFERSDG